MHASLFIQWSLPADHQAAAGGGGRGEEGGRISGISGPNLMHLIFFFLSSPQRCVRDRASAPPLRHIIHDVPNILTLRIPPGGKISVHLCCLPFLGCGLRNIKRLPWQLTQLAGFLGGWKSAEGGWRDAPPPSPHSPTYTLPTPPPRRHYYCSPGEESI